MAAAFPKAQVRQDSSLVIDHMAIAAEALHFRYTLYMAAMVMLGFAQITARPITLIGSSLMNCPRQT